MILIIHRIMKKLFLLISCIAVLASCTSNKQGSDTKEETADVTSKSWQKIEPKEIEGNAVKLFDDEWFELAAGTKDSMNLMTISWGSIGQLWGRPVITVYVSTSRYTNEFMKKSDYFTITHFPESMREKLRYLGSASGRNEDKLKGSGLSTEFTELGNPIFAESDLAIECKKIYAEPFKQELLPEEQRKWYEETNTGVHVVYIGEIVNVWKK